MKIKTKEEFEKYYAKNSKLTAQQLTEMGLIAMPCNCNEPNCKGWQMQSKLTLGI